jgi:penicillin-binding protein 1B
LQIRISRGFWTSRLGLGLLGSGLFFVVLCVGVFTYHWVTYAHMIDQRLSGHAFQNTAQIYPAPVRIFVGQPLTANDLTGYLQRAGYSESSIEGAPGQYVVHRNQIEIRPSAESYFGQQNALQVDFGSREIRSIHFLKDGSSGSYAEVEPELLTNLFDSAREKRRLVRFDDLPKVLVDAVLSAEDKRFFEHPGFDPLRILAAAWADIRHEKIAQGASTITMQVARSFFFSTQRTWRRKVAETLVALQLERRFTKQQIFELYANEIYLGNRSSFAIHGFGEAAQAYFGKDVRDLNVGEAAFLAGIIRSPNRYSSADRKPERATEARSRVLAQMVENRTVSPEQAQAAIKAPLRLVSGAIEGSAAPYFVDMVKDHLLDHFSEAELLSQNFRIYTTLDPSLQRAATAAVDVGMQNVDKQLARRYARWKKKGEPSVQAQVALVALDPQTGEIKALIGGRDYGQSQLNRALARRQPGSAFKPFVYAAAFDSGVDGSNPVVTPATTVVDEPTTFTFDGKDYTPNNYGEQFYGTVTLREALTRSLNVATVKVAEMVGYGRVVQISRQLGLDPNIQATPAVALGAYEMTPLEVAAGYTVFAHTGTRAEPTFIRKVVSANGSVLESSQPRTRPALDPRVAYLVTSVLQDVVNRGTGAGVRARGFTAPAAGKTGTSHDGWFAGFTSNLLCVIWVGFDDNRELGLSGSSSAAPIWAEFMKRAVTLPAYRDVHSFSPPEGVVTVTIDPGTLQLATPNCPTTREEVYIRGTEPTEFCERHGGRMFTGVPPVSWLSRLFGGNKSAAPPAPPGRDAAGDAGRESGSGTPPPGEAQPGKNEKKKGVLNRIFGIFGGGKKDQERRKPGPGESP